MAITPSGARKRIRRAMPSVGFGAYLPSRSCLTPPPTYFFTVAGVVRASLAARDMLLPCLIRDSASRARCLGGALGRGVAAAPFRVTGLDLGRLFPAPRRGRLGIGPP